MLGDVPGSVSVVARKATGTGILWDVSGVSTARMGRVVMNSFETNVVCENPRIHSVGGPPVNFATP